MSDGLEDLLSGDRFGDNGSVVQQQNKRLNEKRRREQESFYMEELAELISASISDMTAIRPDKCAILQETVNQIFSIREEKSLASEAVQQSQVSSSNPTVSDILGPLLLQALDGFLFVVNSQAIVEFVSENVVHYLKYAVDDLQHKTIYTLIHDNDHNQFSNILLRYFTGNWPMFGNKPDKSYTFNCRMQVKNTESFDETSPMGCKAPAQYEYMQVTALCQNSDAEAQNKDKRLICVARRVSFTEKATAMLGVEQFTTRQDVDGKILQCDMSNVHSSGPFVDFVNHNILDFCHSTDTIQLQKHHQEVMLHGVNTSGVYRFRIQENRYVFVQTRSRLFTPAGKDQPPFVVSTHSIVRECDTDAELKGTASSSLMKSIIGQTAGPRRDLMSMSLETKVGGPSAALKLASGGGGRLFDMSLPAGPVSDLDIPSADLLEYLANISDQEADLLVNGSECGLSNAWSAARPTGLSRASSSSSNGAVARASSVDGVQRRSADGVPGSTPLHTLLTMEPQSVMPFPGTATGALTPGKSGRGGLRLRAASRESDCGKRSPTKLRQLLQPDLDLDDNMKPMFQLRSLPGQPTTSDSNQSPQPGPGDTPILVRGDSVTEERVRSDSVKAETPGPGSGSKQRKENTILKKLLNEPDDAAEEGPLMASSSSEGGVRTPGSGGSILLDMEKNEAEPKRTSVSSAESQNDNPLLKELLNWDKKDPSWRGVQRQNTELLQKLLTDEEEANKAAPAESTSQEIRSDEKGRGPRGRGRPSEQSTQQQAQPMFEPVDRRTDEELNSLLTNLWDRQTTADDSSATTSSANRGVKRKLSRVDRLDSLSSQGDPLPSPVTPTGGAGGKNAQSVLLKKLLSKQASSPEGSHAINSQCVTAVPQVKIPRTVADAVRQYSMQGNNGNADTMPRPRLNSNSWDLSPPPLPLSSPMNDALLLSELLQDSSSSVGGLKGESKETVLSSVTTAEERAVMAQIEQMLQSDDFDLSRLITPSVGGDSEQMAIDAIEQSLRSVEAPSLLPMDTMVGKEDPNPISKLAQLANPESMFMSQRTQQQQLLPPQLAASLQQQQPQLRPDLQFGGPRSQQSLHMLHDLQNMQHQKQLAQQQDAQLQAQLAQQQQQQLQSKAAKQKRQQMAQLERDEQIRRQQLQQQQQQQQQLALKQQQQPLKQPTNMFDTLELGSPFMSQQSYGVPQSPMPGTPQPGSDLQFMQQQRQGGKLQQQISPQHQALLNTTGGQQMTQQSPHGARQLSNMSPGDNQQLQQLMQQQQMNFGGGKQVPQPQSAQQQLLQQQQLQLKHNNPQLNLLLQQHQPSQGMMQPQSNMLLNGGQQLPQQQQQPPQSGGLMNVQTGGMMGGVMQSMQSNMMLPSPQQQQQNNMLHKQLQQSQPGGGGGGGLMISPLQQQQANMLPSGIVVNMQPHQNSLLLQQQQQQQQLMNSQSGGMLMRDHQQTGLMLGTQQAQDNMLQSQANMMMNVQQLQQQQQQQLQQQQQQQANALANMQQQNRKLLNIQQQQQQQANMNLPQQQHGGLMLSQTSPMAGLLGQANTQQPSPGHHQISLQQQQQLAFPSPQPSPLGMPSTPQSVSQQKQMLDLQQQQIAGNARNRFASPSSVASGMTSERLGINQINQMLQMKLKNKQQAQQQQQGLHRQQEPANSMFPRHPRPSQVPELPDNMSELLDTTIAPNVTLQPQSSPSALQSKLPPYMSPTAQPSQAPMWPLQPQQQMTGNNFMHPAASPMSGLMQKQVSTGPRPDEGRLSSKVNPMTPQPPTPHMMGGVDMGVHSPFLSGGQDVVSPLSQPSPYAGSLLPSGLQQQQQHPLARQPSYGTMDMSQILAVGNKSPNKPMSTMLPDGKQIVNGSPQASSSLVKQELREKLLSSVGSGGGRLGASVQPLAAQPQSRDDFLSFIDFDSLPHDIHSNSSELPLDVLESLDELTRTHDIGPRRPDSGGLLGSVKKETSDSARINELIRTFSQAGDDQVADGHSLSSSLFRNQLLSSEQSQPGPGAAVGHRRPTSHVIAIKPEARLNQEAYKTEAQTAQQPNQTSLLQRLLSDS